jgi:hypothetical protein
VVPSDIKKMKSLGANGEQYDGRRTLKESGVVESFALWIRASRHLGTLLDGVKTAL